MPCDGFAAYHLKLRVPYEVMVRELMLDPERKRDIAEFCRWMFFAPTSERDYKTEMYVCFFRPQTTYYVRKKLMEKWLRVAGIAEEHYVIPWSCTLKKPAKTVRHWFETKQSKEEEYSHIGKTPFKLSKDESTEKVLRQVKIMQHIKTYRMVPPDLVQYMQDYPLFVRTDAYKKIKELLDEYVPPLLSSNDAATSSNDEATSSKTENVVEDTQTQESIELR